MRISNSNQSSGVDFLFLYFDQTIFKQSQKNSESSIFNIRLLSKIDDNIIPTGSKLQRYSVRKYNRNIIIFHQLSEEFVPS